MSYLFVWLIARTTLRQTHLLVIAGVAGGLAAFVPTMSVAGLMIYDGQGGWILRLLLGPACATLCCQIGAVWASLPAIASNREDSSNRTRRTSVPDQQQEQQTLRFEIRQLLIATAWVAALLGVLKAMNLLVPWFAAIVAGWLVYQAVTLAIVIVVVKKVRGYE
ncbi:hypothetical protein [Aeoliella mucimassa]|nr:hypothetical protein [Aeoliella mucimassa]